MKNKSLREWVDENKNGRGSGRISALARRLNITQPAVSKIIDGSVDIQFKYLAEIIKFTGIKAKDLIPEYYELFKDDFANTESNLHNEIYEQKEIAIRVLKKAISNIENQ